MFFYEDWQFHKRKINDEDLLPGAQEIQEVCPTNVWLKPGWQRRQSLLNTLLGSLNKLE